MPSRHINSFFFKLITFFLSHCSHLFFLLKLTLFTPHHSYIIHLCNSHCSHSHHILYIYILLFINKYKQIFARWQAILSVFDFEIEFIKGYSNVLPDFLSREFLQEK